jgi:hypothetical protein
MRFRSLVTVSATSCVLASLAAAVLRCGVPPLPPGPEALPTSARLATGAVVAVPPGATVDRGALIAALKEMSFSTVILQASADASGESVADHVSLAVELQAALGGNVFVGGYQASAWNGQGMDGLLQTDATFKTCYPGGPNLDASAPVIDKLRTCAQDIQQRIADELARVSASPRIGCYVTHQPQLADGVTDAAGRKLHDFFRDASSACTKAKRPVAVSPILPARPGAPAAAAAVLRSALQDTGTVLVVLEDGVGRFAPSESRRALAYYDALRVALDEDSLQVWAAVEAFDCAGDAGCDRTHPSDSTRFDVRVCGARNRADKIIASEFLRDLAGRALLVGGFDASSDASAGLSLEDIDASTQLRTGYLTWVDAGALCASAIADEADASARADAAAAAP